MKPIYTGALLVSLLLGSLSEMNVACPLSAAEPTEQQTRVESEFASVEEARAVEKKLLALSDKVAPAVVKLLVIAGEDQQLEGSGVVIYPSGLISTHGHHG